MMNSEVYFGSFTRAAQELIALENLGGPIPTRFDFAVEEVCASCMQDIKPPKKVFFCDRCKAVIYCSAEVRCQKNSSHQLIIQISFSAQTEPGVFLYTNNRPIKCSVQITR